MPAWPRSFPEVLEVAELSFVSATRRNRFLILISVTINKLGWKYQ